MSETRTLVRTAATTLLVGGIGFEAIALFTLATDTGLQLDCQGATAKSVQQQCQQDSAYTKPKETRNQDIGLNVISAITLGATAAAFTVTFAGTKRAR